MPDRTQSIMAEMIAAIAGQTAQEIIMATVELEADPSQDSSREAVVAMGTRKLADSYSYYAIAMTGMSLEDWGTAVAIEGMMASREAGLMR